MSDRIVLRNMRFQGRHGVHPQEQQEAQPFEVDAELHLNLHAAGVDDNLELTADYSRVFDTCKLIVESTTFRLIEALAEAIASEILADFPPVHEVVVRVRKPEVKLSGPLDYAGVEIHRHRVGRPS